MLYKKVGLMAYATCYFSCKHVCVCARARARVPHVLGVGCVRIDLESLALAASSIICLSARVSFCVAILPSAIADYCYLLLLLEFVLSHFLPNPPSICHQARHS